MKKSTLFKTIAAAALMVVVGNGAFAQTNPQVIAALPSFDITKGDTSYLAEYATIGAQMPYMVHADKFFKNRTTIFNPSGFKWTNDFGKTFTTIDQNALTEFSTGLYADTLVRIDYAGVSAGSHSIGVTEMSRPKNGEGCDGNSRSLTVNVVAKPVLALAAAQSDTLGACSVPVAGYYEFAYDFTLPGVSDSVYISYNLSATDFDGSAVGTAKDYIVKLSNADKLRIYPSQILTVTGASAVPSGSYKVTINGVWDEVSVRALNRNDSGFFTNPGDSNDVVMIVYPAPATSPIKRVKSL